MKVMGIDETEYIYASEFVYVLCIYGNNPKTTFFLRKVLCLY
jgi:hypothetical protein